VPKKDLKDLSSEENFEEEIDFSQFTKSPLDVFKQYRWHLAMFAILIAIMAFVIGPTEFFKENLLQGKVEVFSIEQNRPPKAVDFKDPDLNLIGKEIALTFEDPFQNKDVEIHLCAELKLCFLWKSLIAGPDGMLSENLNFPDKNKEQYVEFMVKVHFNNERSFDLYFPVVPPSK